MRYVPGTYVATPEYNSWLQMMQRCTNPNDPRYDRYGGRGISVCSRWRTSFKAFREDMGARPEGKTLERVDNDGHYELGNCRWATAKEQAHNRHNTVFVSFQGEMMCLAEAARLCSVNENTVKTRLKRGWTVHEALTTPARTYERK